GHVVPIERLELVADRHPLIELPQIGRLQQRLQVELPDENDLQQLLFVGLQVRKNANLLEDREGEVLRLVDDQHRVGLEGHQTEEKIVQGVDERLLADLRQRTAFHLIVRDDAEVLKDPLEQILLGDEGIED